MPWRELSSASAPEARSHSVSLDRCKFEAGKYRDQLLKFEWLFSARAGWSRGLSNRARYCRSSRQTVLHARRAPPPHRMAIITIQVDIQYGGVKHLRSSQGEGLIDRRGRVTDVHPRSASMSLIMMRTIISSSTTRISRKRWRMLPASSAASSRYSGPSLSLAMVSRNVRAVKGTNPLQ
jgi:hypothetical protein